MKVILASSSPRRKEIISFFRSSFEIISPDIDETPLCGENPQDFSVRVAADKLQAVMSQYHPTNEKTLIIACDTIVTIDNKILGKPVDHQDAINMLAMLSGKNHQVISGLAICQLGDNNQEIITNCSVTDVVFKNISLNEIESYLQKTEYRDKAGSYAIQDNSEMLIEKIDGSLSNVIGFPVRLFIDMLLDLDLLNEFFQ